MRTLLIGPGSGTAFDLPCVAAGRFVLWRRGGEVGLTLDDRYAEGVRAALACSGVRTAESAGTVPESPQLHAAIGIGLAPARFSAADELDTLDVRVVPLSEATADLTRRRFGIWTVGGLRRSRCRALLRGTDALLEVRRSAWCSRSTLSAARHSLRPVLFDRTATARVLRIYASDGVLARWISG